MGLLVDRDTSAHADEGDSEHVSWSPPQRAFVIATLVNAREYNKSKRHLVVVTFLFLLFFFRVSLWRLTTSIPCHVNRRSIRHAWIRDGHRWREKKGGAAFVLLDAFKPLYVHTPQRALQFWSSEVTFTLCGTSSYRVEIDSRSYTRTNMPATMCSKWMNHCFLMHNSNCTLKPPVETGCTRGFSHERAVDFVHLQ